LLLNPTKIESCNKTADQVSKVVFERTKLKGEPGKQQAVGTGEIETIPADLVIVSVGYKGEPLEGMDDKMFDHQGGVIANNHGKVSGDNNIFAAGWIKRGPTGIIGSNITDAKDTVSSIMKYITSECQNANESPKGRAGLVDHLESNGTTSITWGQYLKIDQAERDPKRLRNNVQPREKILSIKEMLDCLQ
jgi:adrenodoxin-NADP+ reductase